MYLFNNNISCRLLLPYERYQHGEETKVRLTHGRRTKSLSDDLDIKEESSDIYPSETSPPIETIPTTTTPPLQPLISTTVIHTNLFLTFIYIVLVYY